MRLQSRRSEQESGEGRGVGKEIEGVMESEMEEVAGMRGGQ